MAKQLKIAGTEEVADPEINAAAEAYVAARDKRMKLTEKEVTAKKTLIDIMKKKNLSIYRDTDTDPPLLVTLTQSDSVKLQAKDTTIDLSDERAKR